MVLSCIDLVSVLTIYPGILLYLVSWLREDYDFLRMMSIYPNFVYRFLGFSTFTLLVISIERYLGAYYPIFHHTLVTRRKTANSPCNITHLNNCHIYNFWQWCAHNSWFSVFNDYFGHISSVIYVCEL